MEVMSEQDLLDAIEGCRETIEDLEDDIFEQNQKILEYEKRLEKMEYHRSVVEQLPPELADRVGECGTWREIEVVRQAMVGDMLDVDDFRMLKKLCREHCSLIIK